VIHLLVEILFLLLLCPLNLWEARCLHAAEHISLRCSRILDACTYGSCQYFWNHQSIWQGDNLSAWRSAADAVNGCNGETYSYMPHSYGTGRLKRGLDQYTVMYVCSQHIGGTFERTVLMMVHLV
jgi:hypothetical protein